MKNLFIFLTLSIILFSCVSKTEYDKIVKENEDLNTELIKLKQDLEMYQFSPNKLCANIDKLVSEKNINELEKIKNLLLEYHPESEELKKVIKYCNQVEKEIIYEKELEKKKRLQAVNKLKKKYDDVSGITWYETPYFIHYNNENLTSIYIGKKGEKVWLRLKMSYSGEDWIFFEEAYLSYDGNTHQIFFSRYDDKKTDNSGGKVWEWIDVSVNDNLLLYLREMVNGKSVKMRLSGKYTETRYLSSKEIKSIKEVLLAYDVLKNESIETCK